MKILIFIEVLKDIAALKRGIVGFLKLGLKLLDVRMCRL